MHNIDKWSSRYSTASFFLSLLLAVSVALVLQRHIELERALDDKANCTQWILDLSTKVGKCGEEQLTELKKCRTDHNNLTEMVGRCVVYKQNLEDNSTTLAVLRHRELLETMLQDGKYQIADEKERNVQCTKHLKNLQDKSDSLLKSSQTLVVEKEKCSHELKTSQKSLITSQNSLTKCETSLAACNKKKGGRR